MQGDAPLTAGALTLDVPARLLRGPAGEAVLSPLLAHVLAAIMHEPGRLFGRADLVELVRTGPDPRLAVAQNVAERITAALADVVSGVGAPDWLQREQGYSVEVRRRSVRKDRDDL